MSGFQIKWRITVIKSFKRVFAIALLSGLAMTVFAEDAPVYDVDNYPPQFDGQPDGGSAGTQQPAPPSSDMSSRAQSSSEDAASVGSSPQVSRSMPEPRTMDQRMSRVEQQITNLQHADSSAKMSTLQTEVQALRGQVEDLTHQVQQMQAQQRSMYSDLDKRLNKQAPAATPVPAPTDDAATSKIEQKKSSSTKKARPALTTASIPAGDEPPAEDKPVASPKPAVAPAATPVAAKAPMSASAEQEELQMYQNAYDLIKDTKFDQAIAVLQNMLKKYPSGQSAANAHYWLGELYGLQKKREQAAVEFSTVVTNYPDSPKVSDAQVKLGMIYAAQFKWPEAKATFKKVISRYPGTTSARLAAQQLKEIKSGGH